ncbi:uncharacterized protein LOC114462606 [Gouania willdenowi]|uniref:ATP-dependent DNA helicase n=1 Tax=Gouania willdenowi TaxID=441366 RepID=A0A8C5I1T2_GOUWI|nr:uncharacterized protein LOC114462606 [Gouania willdenowi]
MPKNRRAETERKREAMRQARDAESPEVRNARLARNAARSARRRLAETDEERSNRLASNAACRARRRATQMVEEQRYRLAWCDDTDFFKEELYGDFTHTLSITSLFECPTCVHCSAYVWKEERKGFCCMSGKIDLTYNSTNLKPGSIPPQPPIAIKNLFMNQDFVKQAKQYNNALAMASIGIKEIAMPGFNPGVRIQGKVHHFIVCPLPEQGQWPNFLQLYYHEPSREMKLRRTHASNNGLNKEFLFKALKAIRKYNPYVQQFKSAIEYMNQNDTADDLRIVLTAHSRRRHLHHGPVNHPSLDSDVAVIAPGTTPTEQFGKLAVNLNLRGGHLHKIDAIHPAYDPLSYVLLLPQGSQGYHTELIGVTPTNFYQFHLQVRNTDRHFNLLHRGGKLTQQYVCDMMAKIESHRLNWIRQNQKSIKAGKYVIVDALSSDTEIVPGRQTILPPTISGSPRWYAKEFQDAMALVRVKGKPDFFLTFTCNPNWAEIKRSLFEGQRPHQRPDIIARVFHMKVEALLTDLLKHDILGHVDAFVMVKETQKRHLPYIRMLITMVQHDKPKTSTDIDCVISAEIPNKDTNPQLHHIVTSHMIHGPCGQWNRNSPCMVDRKCSKDYPKQLRHNTSFSDNSYPLYRRRAQDAPGSPNLKTIRGGINVPVNNEWVVPYNPFLLLRYNAHINLEIVSTVSSVKYLCKYLEKGPDQCLVRLNVAEDVAAREQLRHDEVTRYELGRYVTASEAYWQIYEFPVQQKTPSVKMLAIHLEDEQVITFNDEGAAHNLMDAGTPATTLTAFFKAMSLHPHMRHIVYPDVFQHFTYNGKTFKLQNKRLSSHNHRKADTVGRIPMIAFNAHTAELFYLRILLYHVPGPTSFRDLRKVGDVVMDTYLAACIAHGIVDNDQEVDSVMEEAASVTFGPALREVFATMLMFVLRGEHLQFWERHKRVLSEDFMHRAAMNEPNEYILNQVLLDLKDCIERHGFTLSGNFGLPEPILHDHNQTPRIIQHETEHNMEELQAQITQTENTLNHEQKTVVKTVMESVEHGLGKMIALNASSGTGKTFVLCHILNKVRAEGKVALATAASCIAATLLPKGTTFHSKTKCPLILTDESTCAISEHDSTATLIRMAHLMVVDEVAMLDRRALEAADRTFQWLRRSDKPFGGITMVFGVDWRQFLTVVPQGSRTEIIGRCCKSSYLWKNVETLSLTINMRISQATEHQQAQEDFAKFLLDLGEAKIPIVPEEGEFAIKLNDTLTIPGDNLKDIVNWVYEDMQANISCPTWLCERVILCPTNSEVDTVNEYMTEIFPGEEHVCYSIDTADSEGHHMYPTEFLNTLCPSGMPPHCISLKVGMVIMLLQNFDQQNGHCNGSRYIIEEILPHLLVTKSLIGVNAGRTLLIPRITLIPSDNIFPFTLRRKQFPVRPCFAMTVKKSQGQSLQRVGVFSTRDFFSHGQFYVAASRVGRSNRLRILVLDEETKKKRHFLSNVVYTEVLTQ